MKIRTELFPLGALALVVVVGSAFAHRQGALGNSQQSTSPKDVTQCVTPPSGMVDWWPGDNSAIDIQGNHNGTLQDGATFADGEVNRAFSFNGSGAYVTFGPDAGNFGTSDFTVDFWIQSSSTRDEEVINKRPVCDHSSFWSARLHGGAMQVELDQDSSGTNYNLLSGVTPVNDGIFHHVAIARSGTTASLYVDGVLDASGSTAGVTNISNTADLLAGKSPCVGSGSNFFTGSLDEIEIFNRALSSGDIQAIFNAGSAGKCKPCAAPPGGLIDWWPAGGNTDDIVGSNDGTLQNGATFGAGEVNEAFQLDGADDYVDVGSVNLPSTFTIDAWINPNNLSSQPMIVSKDDGTTRSYYFEIGSKGELGAEVITSTGDTQYISTTGAVVTGAWQLVAMTYDGSAGADQKINFYVNGVLVPASHAGSNDSGGSPNATALSTKIGIYGDAASYAFNGSIDEVEFSNVVLAPTDIQAIYTAGSAGKCRSCTPAPPNMIAWWKAEGDATDSIDSHDGTLQGATFGAGEVGQAFSFDGADSYVTFGPDIGNFGTSDFTVDFWIQIASSRNEEVIGKRPVCDNASFWDVTKTPAGTLYIELDQDSSGTNYNFVQGSRVISDGAFHHVAVVRSGTTASIYVDGVLDNSGNTPGVTNISNTADLIAGKGACGGSGAFSFTGMLDEIEVFNRALSAEEIRAIADAGSAGKCAPAPTPTPTPTPSPTPTPTPAPGQVKVSVTASPTQIIEGQRAAYTVHASKPVTRPTTVHYAMSGTATLGSDYVLNPGTPGQVTIPAGQSMATVTLISRVDPVTEGAETAIMTLQPGKGYRTGNPSQATVSITDKP